MNEVRYLLVGGYAVGYHGYPRATVDLDVWVDREPVNVNRVLKALREFGFPATQADHDALLAKKQVLRMGVPPMRIEILSSISGVEFSDCYGRRRSQDADDVVIDLIALEDLRRNKRAAGRTKDLGDLEALPEA